MFPIANWLETKGQMGLTGRGLVPLVLPHTEGGDEMGERRLEDREEPLIMAWIVFHQVGEDDEHFGETDNSSMPSPRDVIRNCE